MLPWHCAHDQVRFRHIKHFVKVRKITFCLIRYRHHRNSWKTSQRLIARKISGFIFISNSGFCSWSCDHVLAYLCCSPTRLEMPWGLMKKKTCSVSTNTAGKCPNVTLKISSGFTFTNIETATRTVVSCLALIWQCPPISLTISSGFTFTNVETSGQTDSLFTAISR